MLNKSYVGVVPLQIYHVESLLAGGVLFWILIMHVYMINYQGYRTK
jgi:hypothetical protein